MMMTMIIAECMLANPCDNKAEMGGVVVVIVVAGYIKNSFFRLSSAQSIRSFFLTHTTRRQKDRQTHRRKEEKS